MAAGVCGSRPLPSCGVAARSAARAARPRAARATPVCAAATPGVLDVTEVSFEEEVLKSPVPVLVDFWASWCGPCKLISKVVGVVAQEFGSSLKVVKIETDGNPALVEKYGVYGLPTVLLFRDGEMLTGSKREGAVTKDKLIAHLATFGIDLPTTPTSSA